MIGAFTLTLTTGLNIDGGGGGAIHNSGTLTITNTTISNSITTVSGAGGAIISFATLTVSNSTFAGNSAGNGGGANGAAEGGAAQVWIGTLGYSEAIDRLVTATSSEASDDPLAETLEAAGVEVFRGPLDDVLGRFAGAVAGLDDDDRMLRLTADHLKTMRLFALRIEGL